MLISKIKQQKEQQTIHVPSFQSFLYLFLDRFYGPLGISGCSLHIVSLSLFSSIVAYSTKVSTYIKSDRKEKPQSSITYSSIRNFSFDEINIFSSFSALFIFRSVNFSHHNISVMHLALAVLHIMLRKCLHIACKR